MITPKAMGTDVRLTIFTGESFVVPATIKITAATGEITRNRFPANCMGIDKAMEKYLLLLIEVTTEESSHRERQFRFHLIKQ